MYEASSIEYKSAEIFQVNPGLGVMVLLMFKVPNDFESAMMVCRESVGSAGVALAVTVSRV